MNTPAWLTFESETSTELPAHVRAYRAQQAAAFKAQGLPTRKDERWKYADLHFLNQLQLTPAQTLFAMEAVQAQIDARRLQHIDSILLVVVNGYFIADLSELDKLPAGVSVMPRAEDLQPVLHDIDARLYPMAALNTAISNEGVVISVADNCQLTLPIHLLSLITDEHEVMLSPQHQIKLGAASQLILLEEAYSLATQPYFVNSLINISLAKEARCEHYKIQQEGQRATHMAHTFVEQAQESYFYSSQFSFGGKFARDELVANIRESGAVCETAGFYHLKQDQQFIDHHVEINHLAANSSSEMYYKGIVGDHARAVFNGRLLVAKDAQQTVAQQTNHHLLLAKTAEAYSKPELEIYADDVKCKHGATTGQIDQDALFYLRSRGLTHEEAQSMLLHAFADSVMARIKHPAIREYIQEVMKS